MALHLLRALFLIVVLAVTASFALTQEMAIAGQMHVTAFILIPVILATVLILVDMFWHQKRLQVLSGMFFGVLAGLAIAFVLSLVVDLVASLVLPPEAPNPGTPPWSRLTATSRPAPASGPAASAPAFAPMDIEKLKAESDTYDAALKAYRSSIIARKIVQMIKLLLGAAAVFLCVSFVMQTKDDFRFVIPYVEFSKQTKGARPLLLDTSVIIDGRIADISETRILESEVLVPRFVLAELQAIADSDDKLKRNRGRRGLDVLNRLQSSSKIDIRLLDARVATVEDAPDVDAKLVALAQHLDGRIVTNDYNLNKVAQLRGVDVININDLANALKPIVLPGETMTVKIIKPGEEAGQGIGYLEDGTMVVAEQGRDFIGREVVISVTSVLQTSAGRMIFGRTDVDRSFSRRDRHAPTPAAPAKPAAGPTTGPATPPPAAPPAGQTPPPGTPPKK